MRSGFIISILLILLIAVSAHATEVPTCGGGTADSNAEDGIEIANGVCAELFNDLGAVSGGILVNDGATLTIYGDITSLSDKINIKPGGTLILYGNISSISNGILVDGGTLEIYSNVTVDGGFEIKASSTMILNGAYLTVSSGSGKLNASSSTLELYNGSTIEIVDGASKMDNNANGTISSDNSGNSIETATWDGNQGDFSCASGSCSDSASSAQVIITESGGNTVTTESGTTDSFTVELATPITVGTVRVDLSSGNTGEGTVSPSFVEFYIGNMGAKTVTVTPVDDGVDDGPQFYTITTTTSTPVASTPNYNGVPTPDVGVVNQNDGEFPRIDLTNTTLTTSENGSAQTIDVVIGSEPATGKVVELDVSSGDVTEGTVSPASLTFDEFNWDTPQTVTVTPVDDTPVDGDIDYDVTLSVNTAAGNADGDYNSLADAIVTVTNQDDEVAGFTLNTSATGSTTEGGGTTTFTVVLDNEPLSNVVLRITSLDATEGQVTPSDPLDITFTSADWFTAQTVTVEGLDDALNDGTITYDVRVRVRDASSDDFFDPLADQTVSITNIDDEQALYGIIDGDNNIYEVGINSGLVTDLGATASGSGPSALAYNNLDNLLYYTQKAGQRELHSFDPSDGTNTSKGNTSHSNEIVGLAFDQGNNLFGLDINENLLRINPATGAVTETTALTLQGTGAENVGDLVSSPSGDMLIMTSEKIYKISKTDLDDGAPYTLTEITSKGQSVILGGTLLTEPNTGAFTIFQVSDAQNKLFYFLYEGKDLKEQKDYNTEFADTSPAYLTDLASAPRFGGKISGSVYEDTNINSTKDGGETSPTSYSGNLFLKYVVSGEATARDAIEIDPAVDGSFELDMGLLAGTYDIIIDDNKTLTDITPLVPTDGYNISESGDLKEMINLPANQWGNGVIQNFGLYRDGNISLTPTSGLVVNETGTTATFDVVLLQAPLDDVTITLSSDDATEGSVSPTSLTFGTGDWSSPQTVTITGLDDALADGDIAFNIVTDPATSLDDVYNGLDAPDVAVTNEDDEITNTAPTATGSTVTTDEDTQVTIVFSDLGYADGDADPMAHIEIELPLPAAGTLYVDDTPQNGSYDVGEEVADGETITKASIDANLLKFIPASDENGTSYASFNFFVNDGTENSASTAAITFDVNAVNDDPTITNINSQVTSENTAINGVSFTVDEGGGADEDSQILSVTAVSDNQTVVPDANITVNYTDNGGASAGGLSPTIDISPASNQTGIATITVTVQDDGTGNLTSIETFLVIVDAVSTRGPGGVADQLSYWFMADKGVSTTGSSVDSWVDQSNNGLTATSLLTDRPTLTTSDADINLQASISFDGDDYLTFSHGASDNDDRSYGVVLSIATPTNDRDAIIYESERISIGYRGSGETNPSVLYDRIGGTTNAPSSQTPAGSWLVHQKTVASSGNISYYFDGSVTPETDTHTALGESSTTTYLGETNGLNRGFNGEFGEIYKFRKVLNHAEKTVVDNYLSAKYNLTLTASNFYAGDDGANGHFDFDVIGVGNSTAGAVPGAHTSSIGFDGLALTSVAGFEDDDYVFAGHDGTTNGFNTTDLGGLSGGSRWERIWYIDKTDASTALSVDLTFDFSDAGLSQVPTYASNYKLIYRSGQSGNWTEVTTASSVSGDEVIFSGINLTNGDGYYTISQSQSYSVSTTTASTNESGTTAQFDVVLGAQPATDVVISVVSGNTGEGTVDKASLTFTNANWNTPQTVTITGVDDNIIDGDIIYNVTLSVDDANSDDEFDHLDDQTVSVTNTDDDAAGFTITETAASTGTDESATTDTFDVELDAEPGSNVVITLTSGDTGEGTVDLASLTFTPANWDTPQTVTVTGVDDDIIDGDITYNVTLSVDDASSDDDFDPLADQTVSVTNTDDDVAGFTITETAASTGTDESATTDTFDVELDAEPGSNVVITVTSGDTGEGTVDLASLTFTPANWDTPQTVTVTGVDDDIIDGDITYNVTLSVDDASSDNDFDPLADQTVSVTNTDDDVAGFTITETAASTGTDESATTDTFDVELDAEPGSNVVITLTSGDTGEGTVDLASLTFTPANWDTPQTVTVTGVDDDIIDGDITYNVTLSVDDASSDDDFDPLADQTVSVTNTDDDVAGFTITETAASTDTDESATTDTFDVELDSEPGSNVVITLTSGDTGEGTVDLASLTFTPANWDTPQTVTVTGVDDDIIDGDITYNVTLSVDDASSDNDFDPLADQTVSVTNTDDDVAGFTITETAASTGTDESATTDTFDVELNAEPGSNVVITLTSGDTGEGTVDLASLTFTPANWDTPQTVTVTGVDDDIIDGDITYNVTLSVDDASSDDDFDPLADQTVSVTNTDDDVAGFTITETAASTGTDESATTDTFDVELDAEPGSNVVITVTSGDTGEGTVDLASLTFTPANWDTPQTVTVTGVDDDIIDGDITYNVTLSVDDASSDNDFDPLADQTVSVTNTDDDVAGFTITETAASTGTDESATTDTFDVELDAEPGSNVVITVTSGDTGEGTVDLASLTFTPANWDTPQTVTVTGVDDDIIDGDITYNVTLSVDDASSDDDFDPLADQTVSVTNTDDDVAGFTITETAASTGTDESATTDTFDVELDSEPGSNVVITLTSGDTGEGTVDLASLTFTPANWDTPQTVTVTGVDDDIIDGDITYNVTLSVDDASSDNDFDPLADQTVSVTNTDDEVAGFTLSKTTSTLTEGNNDTFTIVLDAEPSSNVVVDLSSDDTGAATVSPASLTFTNGNWSSAQTVTISSVQDDDLADETPTITATINDASSDNDFDPLADQTVAVTLTDDDAAGYTLSKTTSAITEGGNDTFTIVLDAQPASDVVIDLSSDDTGAATVSPASLTFTNGNWSSAQTVSISSVQDDDLTDETPTITATINDAASDNDFDPLADQTVAVTLTDDDLAGYTLSKTTSTITEGNNDTFTIVLDAEPSSNVVIDLSSDDTGAATVSPASLTFTNGNWSSAQTVTITALQDDDLANETPTITATINDASSDNDFDPLADQTVAVTLTDDDAASYTLSKTTLAITEGGNDTFTIVLDAQPASNVVIDLSSDDTGAATVSPASLTFTNGNWSSAQTVTISALQDDDLADETPTITATINDASSDNDFDPLADQTVAVTLTDDDAAGYTLSKTTSAITEGGNDTFTIVLDAQPASDVVIDLSSDDTGAATVSPASLTFTNGNWSIAQTVTITSVQDVDSQDETLSITASITASSDANFTSLADQLVAVAVTDDDNIAPVITSQISIPEINEEVSFIINLTDLNVTDPDDSYPTDHTLSIENGANYTVSGNSVAPTENFNGQLKVALKVNDGKDDSNLFDYLVDIRPVNDSPEMVDDVASAIFGTEISGNLLDNDSDVEGDLLTLTEVNPVIDGFTFEANGAYTFSNTFDVGEIVLTYEVCDDGSPIKCSQSTLTLTVIDGDLDGDGIPDSYEIRFDDVDGDGIPEYLDEDSDNDGIEDKIEAGSNASNPVDTDSDGRADFIDLDSDNDGKSDEEEGLEDCDSDGILNYIDAFDSCEEMEMKTYAAFSPNGDGKNDEWVIEGIEIYPNNKVSIFNRWGSKIFEIEGYDNRSKVWRGEVNTGSSAGTNASFSTYYFIIDLKNGSKPIAGNILLSR